MFVFNSFTFALEQNTVFFANDATEGGGNFVSTRQGGKVVRVKTGGHWAGVPFQQKVEVAKGELRVDKGLDMMEGEEEL